MTDWEASGMGCNHISPEHSLAVQEPWHWIMPCHVSMFSILGVLALLSMLTHLGFQVTSECRNRQGPMWHPHARLRWLAVIPPASVTPQSRSVSGRSNRAALLFVLCALRNWKCVPPKISWIEAWLEWNAGTLDPWPHTGCVLLTVFITPLHQSVNERWSGAGPPVTGLFVCICV